MIHSEVNEGALYSDGVGAVFVGFFHHDPKFCSLGMGFGIQSDTINY
jgi:hypothetical protein